MDFQPYMLIILLFWIIVSYFIYSEYKNAAALANSDKYYVYATLAMLAIGVIVRTVFLSYPYWLYVDEAIGGYDSWCLANYGVDQHLAHYPMYLRSWGSGQSALYAYLALPLVKIFGLSIEIFRTPMAILSSTALLVFYYALRKTQHDFKLLFLVVALFVISPWHIMMSRWGLDCNVAPNFMLIAMSFFILAYYNQHVTKQTWLYLGSSLCIVLTAYGYGLSLFMLPLFLLLMLVFLFRHKKITLKQTLVCASVMLIVGLPLILFMYNLLTKGAQYQLGPITITQLKGSRHETMTILGSSNMWLMLLDYIKAGAKLFFWGDDTLRWNSFPLFGQYYNIVGNVFIVIAFVKLYKKANRILLDKLFFICLISTLPILLTTEPNVYHWNLMWFPLIYFFARGVYFVTNQFKLLTKMAYAGIVCAFVVFTAFYFVDYGRKNFQEEQSYIKYAVTSGFKQVHFDYTIIHSVPLFYGKVNPYEYASTRVVRYPQYALEHMTSYANVSLDLPTEILPYPNTIYMISNNMIEGYHIDYSQFKIRRGNAYTLLWND